VSRSFSLGPGQSSRTRDMVKRIFRHENAVLILILVVINIVLAIFTKGFTASRQNVVNVLLQSSIRGIAGIAQLFVILTGGIDLSVGGIALLSAVLGASLLTGTADFQILGHSVGLSVALPLMVLAGTGIGTANGISVSRLRMPALIVTLAVWQILKGGAYRIGHGYTIVNLPEQLSWFGQGQVAGVPTPVILFIVVAVVAYSILNFTTFGRSIYAVGGNPSSSWLSGIRVSNILFSVYIISGFLCGLLSIVYIGRTMSAGTPTASGLELDSIAAAVIGGVSLAGGRGTVIGVVIGALIIGAINNGMNIIGLEASLQDITRGAIIFLAVAIDVLRRR
jgi:ribose/xylose/arabinose/galactoside ABC-type transport system permease subunit